MSSDCYRCFDITRVVTMKCRAEDRLKTWTVSRVSPRATCSCCPRSFCLQHQMKEALGVIVIGDCHMFVCHFCHLHPHRIAASNMHHHILDQFDMVHKSCTRQLVNGSASTGPKQRVQWSVPGPFLPSASLKILLPTEHRCVAHADAAGALAGQIVHNDVGCRGPQHALAGCKQADAQGACTG